MAVFEGPRGEMSKDWAQDVIGLTAQSCSPAWFCTSLCHMREFDSDSKLYEIIFLFHGSMPPYEGYPSILMMIQFTT